MNDIDSAFALNVAQCLFGYDDGHKLLASSTVLAPEVEHYLLELSDLDPNASSLDDGYWTGLPIKEIRSYALMKTWPAPEMPRPGCVWTHTILIKNTDIVKIDDFSCLAKALKKPCNAGEYRDYSEELTIGISNKKQDYPPLSSLSCINAIHSLYSEDHPGVLSSNNPEADQLLFALWSQQWPRLRRSFRFRTGQAVETPERHVFKFDLRIATTLSRPPLQDLNIPPWETVAALDLYDGEHGDFRRFLWRYGSDVRNGLKRFKFLSSLYIQLQADLSGEKIFPLLDYIAAELPSQDDGLLLKKDLLAMGESNYSMLPRVDPVYLMSYLANMPGSSAFPEIPENSLKLIGNLWHQRAKEILALAEQAITSGSGLGKRLVKQLAPLADPSTFFEITKEAPGVREELVKTYPPLLDSAQLLHLHLPDLMSLLTSLPDDDGDLVKKVITRLLPIQTSEPGAYLSARFPRSVRQVLLTSMSKDGTSDYIPKHWISSAKIVLADEFAQTINESMGSSAAIWGCILLSGSSLSLASQLPIELWAKAITNSRDDIADRDRLKYLSFLFILALEVGKKGCEPLFEASFDEVYSAISSSRLPYSSFSEIARRLPDLFFWQQWDTCLRMRIAITEIYKRNNLDRESFNRLSNDPELIAILKNSFEKL